MLDWVWLALVGRVYNPRVRIFNENFYLRYLIFNDLFVLKNKLKYKYKCTYIRCDFKEKTFLHFALYIQMIKFLYFI